MSERVWLEGFISVMAALEGRNRPFFGIYVQDGKWNRRLTALQKEAERQAVPFERVSPAFVQQHASGQSHGGVLAEVGMRHFVPLAELVPADESNPVVMMLDGIEDPFNFGQAVRAMYAAGVAGLVVRERNWLSAAGTVTRASAGATELMPTAQVETAEEAADFFRQRGFLIACTAKEEATSLYAAALNQPLFLLVGGEKRGVTRSFMAQADVRLAIPYKRPFRRSLGAAAAATILSFELMRQRLS